MVDLTDEADADWMARGRPEASDEEHAQLCGDVIARAGRRFFLVRPGIAHGHDAADPLPLDTEASIFDAETRRSTIRNRSGRSSKIPLLRTDRRCRGGGGRGEYTSGGAEDAFVGRLGDVRIDQLPGTDETFDDPATGSVAL